MMKNLLVNDLDALENALQRAETSRKDIDLILVMRILYHILKYMLR